MQAAAWLESLIEIVANCTESHAPPFKMGYHYAEDDGLWEALVYPIPVRLVGGAEDGTILSPGFSVDLRQVSSAFEEVAGLRWSVHHLPDGPQVVIDGYYQGHEVLLRILAEAPEDEEPGMLLEVGDATAATVVN